MSFREEAEGNGKDNGPGNTAVLRRRALDLLRRNTSKRSLASKLERADPDDDLLRRGLNSLAACAICGCAGARPTPSLATRGLMTRSFGLRKPRSWRKLCITRVARYSSAQRRSPAGQLDATGA